MSLLSDLAFEARNTARSVADYVTGNGLRIGVTGLSRAGKTVFITSHNLFEVQQVATRIAILKQGSLVTETTVAELLRSGDEQMGEIWLRVPDIAAASAVIARSADERADRCVIPAALVAMHTGWGAGFWVGVGRGLAARHRRGAA